MTQHDHFLEPGTLWPLLLERTANARQCGAIHSIPTTSETIEHGGIAFHMRIVTPLEKKQAAQAAQLGANPFLPYDPELLVAEISPTHVALLNKFNVVDHHLLIVTRAFEDQQTLLTREDCEALLTCLVEIDGLGFYNAGPAAGASQPHKHLQLIPLPAATGPRLPIEPLLRSVRMAGVTGIAPGLPFLHACALMNPEWLDPRQDGAALLVDCYHSLLQATRLSIRLEAGKPVASAPYNLLVTRHWLLLVPRSEECFEGISINALGFAGALLVRNEAQLAMLRKQGPMTALQRVSLPRQSSLS
jgi:ATP adenylyltransferase